MNQNAPYIAACVAVFGIISSAVVALYIRCKNRTQNGKDSFGVFIRKQLAALPEHGVCEFYDRTKPAIHEAVQAVWHFLSTDERATIGRLWREYDQITKEELHPRNEDDIAQKIHTLAGMNFQYPRDILKYYFDEFYKFAA